MSAAAVVPILGACCCAGMALAISLTMTINYSALLSNASEYDTLHADDAVLTIYDNCGTTAPAVLG